jgi:hypothetical protein
MSYLMDDTDRKPPADPPKARPVITDTPRPDPADQADQHEAGNGNPSVRLYLHWTPETAFAFEDRLAAQDLRDHGRHLLNRFWCAADMVERLLPCGWQAHLGGPFLHLRPPSDVHLTPPDVVVALRAVGIDPDLPSLLIVDADGNEYVPPDEDPDEGLDADALGE